MMGKGKVVLKYFWILEKLSKIIQSIYDFSRIILLIDSNNFNFEGYFPRVNLITG